MVVGVRMEDQTDGPMADMHPCAGARVSNAVVGITTTDVCRIAGIGIVIIVAVAAITGRTMALHKVRRRVRHRVAIREIHAVRNNRGTACRSAAVQIIISRHRRAPTFRRCTLENCS